jgi:hypothetical protein
MTVNGHIRKELGARICATAILLASCVAALADEETASFHMTAIDGYLTLQYMDDEQKSGSSNTTSSTSTWREELFLNTHSYFYHPNLLKMDLGGGPVWVQNQIESAGTGTKDNATLYNLTGRFMFLEQKPYSLTVYYDHLNPTFSTSIGQSFIQTNTKYGSTLTLREPWSPFLFTLDNSRQLTNGEGQSWVTNDEVTQTTARMYRSNNTGGYAQLVLQATQQNSSSGNPALAITPTTVDSENATIDTRFLFGDNKQITNSNTVIANTQSYVQSGEILEHKDFNFVPYVFWQHSDDLSSFYNYNLYNSSDRYIDTTRRSAKTGINYQLKNGLYMNGDLHGDSNSTYGFKQDSYGTNLKMKYSQQLGTSSSLQLGANAIYDEKDRMAAVALVNTYGEQQQLSGTIAVALGREFIDISTIQVFNLTRSQLYCPDTMPLPAGCTVADYRIIVIGSLTQIQRLATGNILDGQSLLVDYAFQTGGDAKFTSLDWGLQANLTVLRNLSFFANYRQLDYRLITGTPTVPMNPVRNTQYGTRIDQPLELGFSVGAEVIFESQDEEFAPYRRDSYTSYIQSPVYQRSTLRLSGRKTSVNYLNSTEDVKVLGWSARLNTGPWGNAVMTAEISHEQDDGGSLPRSQDQLTLGVNWRFRELSLRGEGLRSQETQGSYQREYSRLRVLLTRSF